MLNTVIVPKQAIQMLITLRKNVNETSETSWTRITNLKSSVKNMLTEDLHLNVKN